VAKPIPKGTVSVKVVTVNGTEVVKDKVVQTANVGSKIENYGEPTLPAAYQKGYHLVKTTIQVPGKEANVVTQGDLAKTDVVEGNTQIVYTIAKDSESTTTVTYHTPDGNIVPGTKVTTTTVPGGSKVVIHIVVPKGYKLIPGTPITINGKPVTPDANGNIVVNTGTPEQGTINHIIVPVAPVVHDSVTTTVDGKTVKPGEPGYVAPQTGKEGITGENSGITNIVAPKGYHISGITVITTTPDGKTTTEQVPADKIGSYNVPKTLGTNNVHVVYNLTPNPVKKYTTKVTVTTPDGKEVPGFNPKTITTPAGETVTGTGIVVPKGYKIVKVIVDGKDVTPITNNGTTDIPAITDTNGDHTVHYVIEKVPVAPKTGKVYVKVVNDTTGTTVVENHLVDSGNVGEVATGTNYTAPEGTHITSVTVNGKTVPVSAIPNLTIPNGDANIVYHIANNKPVAPKTGNVVVSVQTQDGKVLYTGPTHSGTVDTNISAGDTAYVNQPGYHVVGLQVNGETISASSTGAFEVPAMKYNDGTQNVVWIVAKNEAPVKPVQSTGKVSVTVQTTTGETLVPTKTTEGTTGTQVSASDVGFTPIKGYHLVKVTVDGNDSTADKVAGLDFPKNSTTNIVWVVAKDATPVKPAVKTGKVTVTVKTENGEILVPTTTQSGDAGTTISKGLEFNPIKGYHLVGTTVDGVSKGVSSISSVTLTDGTTNIVYTVAKDQTPVKPQVQTGNVKVEVITTDNQILVPSHEVASGDVGTEISNGLGFNPIKGYHLVGTTINGVSQGNVSISKITLANGTTEIIYTVAKDSEPVKPTEPTKPQVQTGNATVKVVTSTGEVITPEHEVCSGNVGTDVTGDTITAPKGYHISQITVNGVAVKSVDGLKLTDGTTKIVYTITKNVVEPTTPVKPAEPTTPVKPVEPTTPVKPVEPTTVKPVTPSVVVGNDHNKVVINELPDTGLSSTNADGLGLGIGLLAGISAIATVLFRRKK
ncbi:MAG: LPXTG cell wall anchor domain-containing protein, partial [Sarcina sp.]